jgi:general secretion pathway protein K
MRGEERGFALIAVLLVLALLGILGAEFAYSMRLEASAVRAYRDGIIATHLAEAAVEQAAHEILADWAHVAADPTDACQVVFYGRDGLPLPGPPRRGVTLGGGEFAYCLGDEQARLNVNTSPPDRFDRLLQALGLDKIVRDTINDSVQDWRDPDEEHRLNGAESDYYLALPVPYRSRNGNPESTRELLQIKGVTRPIWTGTDGRPGLGDVVTVKTPGQVNLNTASPAVLQAHGLADAEISEIEQNRRAAPYTVVPGRFAGRGLTTTSRTFRIVAEGRVDGRVAAQVSAIVQKRGEAGAPAVVTLEWTVIQ